MSTRPFTFYGGDFGTPPPSLPGMDTGLNFGGHLKSGVPGSGSSPTSGFPALPGSNQYMSYPTMPAPTGNTGSNVPGVVPNAPGWTPPPGSYQNKTSWIPGTEQSLGSGVRTTPTEDPQFTNEFYQYLTSQLGMGLPAFNLSTALPSGGTTAPGQLNAPLNPTLKLLQDWLTGTGGSTGGPAGPGSPILPIWQSELAAMQLPEQQDLANLRGQAAFAGNLDSSAFGTSLQQYLNQNTLNQQSLLGQLTMQALPTYAGIGEGVQQIDQSAIENVLREFNLTLPQNNPLLAEMYGASQTFPPSAGGYSKGGLSSVLGLLGLGAGGAAAGLSAASGGAGTLGSILAGLGEL